jgi:cell division protein FtsX
VQAYFERVGLPGCVAFTVVCLSAGCGGGAGNAKEVAASESFPKGCVVYAFLKSGGATQRGRVRASLRHDLTVSTFAFVSGKAELRRFERMHPSLMVDATDLAAHRLPASFEVFPRHPKDASAITRRLRSLGRFLNVGSSDCGVRVNLVWSITLRPSLAHPKPDR